MRIEAWLGDLRDHKTVVGGLLEGRMIQKKDRSPGGGEWRDVGSNEVIHFTEPEGDYRVKPLTEYVPYSDPKQVPLGMHIVHPGSGRREILSSCGATGANNKPYQELFDQWKFDDGKPVGLKRDPVQP